MTVIVGCWPSFLRHSNEVARKPMAQGRPCGKGNNDYMSVRVPRVEVAVPGRSHESDPLLVPPNLRDWKTSFPLGQISRFLSQAREEAETARKVRSSAPKLQADPLTPLPDEWEKREESFLSSLKRVHSCHDKLVFPGLTRRTSQGASSG